MLANRIILILSHIEKIENSMDIHLDACQIPIHNFKQFLMTNLAGRPPIISFESLCVIEKLWEQPGPASSGDQVVVGPMEHHIGHHLDKRPQVHCTLS